MVFVEIFNQHTRTFKVLAQDGKTFHTHKKEFFSLFCKKHLLLSPPMQSFYDQNFDTIQDSNTSNMIRIDLHT